MVQTLGVDEVNVTGRPEVLEADNCNIPVTKLMSFKGAKVMVWLVSAGVVTENDCVTCGAAL